MHLTPCTSPLGRFFRTVVLAALAMTASTSAEAAPQPKAAKAVNVLRTRAQGHATFVTGVNGRPIAVTPAAGQTRIQPMDFLRQHGRVFGVTDPNRQLSVTKTDTDTLGQTHTTYQQVHEGVPVFSGTLKVHQNVLGEVVVANGDFYPITPKLETKPKLTADRAEAAAQAALPQTLPQGAQPGVEHSELVIVDPGWYGDPPMGAHLAYYVILSDLSVPVREAFFVDAHTGTIVDQWTLLHTARDRVIFDDTTNLVVRTEGGPPTGDPEADQAYDYAGDTYDFFFRSFGRDGMDHRGGTMYTVVRSQRSQCPNAWGGSAGTIFCVNLAVDDVVGHEWGHALTDFTGNLIYQNQPGQLNESYSDIWGELIDLYNGDASLPGLPGGTPWPTPAGYVGPGTDTPNTLRGTSCSGSVRWMIGEDSSLNVIRDMWNPPCFNDPDRGYSPLQTCNPGDSGGVHSGSGIPNHAFAIMTDGKTFNGYTVNAIGPIKAAAVWYRALVVYMTLSSDFEDAYYALMQSANDLVGTTPNDPRPGGPGAGAITVADVAEVDKALQATEMNGPGACGAEERVMISDAALRCFGRTTVFSDDFESGPGGWTVSNSAPPTPYDWALTTTPLPFGRLGVAWFIEDRDIGDCAAQDESAVHSLQSPAIVLPADADFPMLSFTHNVRTEGSWDGANLEIQVNGGGWQSVPRDAFERNPYNARLNTVAQGNSNPKAGEMAWSGVSEQWGASVVDLSGFAGANDTIDLRFELGKDGCTGYLGWHVDDVEVYHCPDCNASGTPEVKESSVSFESPALAGIGAGSPQTFTITTPPAAASDVTLSFTAVGNFRFSQRWLDVSLNGDDIGPVFNRLSTDCPPTPDTAQIVIDPERYNTAVGGADAIIEMTTPATVDETSCLGDSYVTVVVSYDVTGASAEIITFPPNTYDPGPVPKNRYATLRVGGAPDLQMALRVTFVDLPPPFDCHNGEVRWVDTPRNVTEIPGQTDDEPPTFLAAGLSSTPVLFDSDINGLLHVFGEEIVPEAVIEFQPFDGVCGMLNENTEKAPVTVDMTPRWGDTLENCATTPCGPPDGTVNLITDCVGIVDKFGGLPGAPIKARTDLRGAVTPSLPDQRIDIVDVILCVDAFQGDLYPYDWPEPCP